MKPLFLLLAAPSGAGKSTLIKMLREEFPQFGYSVSCTTRAPRGAEKDGVAYHFLTDEQFDARVAAGEFLEHAVVHGHQYGTLKNAVLTPLSRGESILLDIDVAGASQVRSVLAQEAPDSVLRTAFLDVFIMAPSEEELRRRLVNRGEDAMDVIEKRIANSRKECERKNEFSHVIVNDELETAYGKLRELVLGKTGTTQV